MPFTEISVTDAYQLLADDPSAVLIDVRTPEEWTQIGVPTLESIGKRVRFATWTWFGTGERNPNFLAEATEGLDAETPRFLCRSGARSQGAAALGRGGRLRHHLQRDARFEVVPAQPVGNMQAFPGCQG